MRDVDLFRRAIAMGVVFFLGMPVLCMQMGSASASTCETVSTIGNLPVPRVAAATALVDGKIYVIGGAVDDLVMNQTTIFDTKTGEISYGANANISTVYSACSVGIDDLIYVFGGMNDTFFREHVAVPVTSTQIYNPRANTWRSGATSPCNLNVSTAVTLTDGRILVASIHSATNSTLIYNPTSDSWTYAADMPHPRMYAAIAVWNDTAVYVFGGGGPSDTFARYVDAYNPKNNTWTAVANLPADLVVSAAVASSACSRIYYVGGTLLGPSYEVSKSIYRYDPVADAWSASTASLASARCFFGNALVDEFGRVFVAGGMTIERDAAGRAWQRNLSSIEMIIPYPGLAKVIKIISPSDGSNVAQGMVTVQIDVLSGDASSAIALDIGFDGVVSRTGFVGQQHLSLWNTQDLALESYHTITARVFFTDGSYATDTIQVKISSIEEELTIDDLMSQNAQLRQDIMNLSAELNSTRSEIRDDVERIRSESRSADTYAMLSVVLILVLIALVILSLFMGRRIRGQGGTRRGGYHSS